jgi:hypothetical protein
MADLAHWFDDDLQVSATGDLLTIDGTVLGQQRVVRRLLTNPGSYIWHPEYGAGLPSYVGQTLDKDAIGALILSQLLLESAVSQSPPPQVTVTPITGGVFVQILYVDSDTGKQVNLSFDVFPES